ncbi:hypothetical protein [Stappia sp.]|uniref:hypothetical protein n=1 Tax=Stappia sp. TaxID=1870903 RepID=UPI0032D924DC
MEWLLSRTEEIRNWFLVVGGTFGLYLAWLRVTAANRQADAQLRQSELARRGHVSELFNRAVGQLGDDRLEIRLGAIFTLRQLCFDFDDLAEPVIQLLTAYIRDRQNDYGDEPPPVDVQEIAAILRDLSERRR